MLLLFCMPPACFLAYLDLVRSSWVDAHKHTPCSVAKPRLFVTPWTASLQAPCPLLSPRVCSNSCSLSQWCYLTISSSVAPFSFCLKFPQHQCIFQQVGSFYKEAKVLELQLKHQYFQWIVRLTGLIDFRIDWFHLLAAQGTLKSLLQHHRSKASVFQCSAF